MANTQETLIREEQEILDDLIRDMDSALLALDEKLTNKQLQAQKAKAACLPDAYGMLVSAEDGKSEARQQMRDLRKGKDELYETRLVLDITDELGHDCKEYKLGKWACSYKDHIFIYQWKMPLFRPYVLGNDTEGVSEVNENGKRFITHSQLRLKRKLNIFSGEVKSVTHFFPTMDVTEQIIVDEFLQELLSRRTEEEFKNIIFSIQKKQGEIIQAPFDQNLIVQGCAGSGKSMVMLHRLPIVLYDNPNSLDRNNLYIITPSITYIQMAENMRVDLEIADLKMGTLEQYYNFVLGKYRLQPEIYGPIKANIRLSKEDLQYVYSAKCIDDISIQIEEIVNGCAFDYKRAYAILNIKEKRYTKNADTPADRLHVEVHKIQAALNQNNDRLKSLHRNIYNLLEQLKKVARMMEEQKTDILDNIKRQIKEKEKIIDEKEKEIREIGNRENHEVMYQNRLNSIRAAQNMIRKLKKTQETVELDDSYFEGLRDKAKPIHQVLSMFEMVKNNRSKMSLSEQYAAIDNRELLYECCREVLEDAAQSKGLYLKYLEYTVNLSSGIRKLKSSVKHFNNNRTYLPLDYLRQLMDAKTCCEKIAREVVQKTYLSLMKRLGQEPDENGHLDALEYSPYLYLQILYQFRGMPNAARESLIVIDEAQNVAPEELKLIKAVNGNSVILNLFGDVRQHVEGSKGINDWEQFSDIARFKKEYLQENYRNARQITAYCNKRFKLDMQAINLDGAGVHDIKSESEFDTAFYRIFQKSNNVGLSCFIVKNKKEADMLLAKAGSYTNRIHNITGGLFELVRNKWNLMTVEQAKGLEFRTVFAVTGRMDENEKYIAYTRALDELYVYDAEIDLDEIETAHA